MIKVIITLQRPSHKISCSNEYKTKKDNTFWRNTLINLNENKYCKINSLR